MLPAIPSTVLFWFESCTSSFVWTSDVFSSLLRLGSENVDYCNWLSLIFGKNMVHTLSLHSVMSWDVEMKVRTRSAVKKWQVHHVKTSVAKGGHVENINSTLLSFPGGGVSGGIGKSWNFCTIAEVRGHMLLCDYWVQMWILDLHSTAGHGQFTPNHDFSKLHLQLVVLLNLKVGD